MPADLYRDASLGIRARLGELESKIRERESELTDAFWASLDGEVRERLHAMRGALDVVQSHAGLDALARAEGRLATYLEELDRWIAKLPAMEEEWRELPDVVADPPASRDSGILHLPSEEERALLERSLTAVVRERDR